MRGRVLVTGAGGMLGRNLVSKLVREGVEVRAMLGPGDSARVLPDEAECVIADVTHSDALPPVVSDVTSVVHLAGPPSVADSFLDPATFARVHTLGTANLLTACRDASVSRFCYVSSAEVYGRTDESPVAETAMTVPRSPYGAAKLGAESLARAFCPAEGIELVVLRPFSVYGPDSPTWSLLGTLLRQATVGTEVRLAALDPVRDFVFVDDVAGALSQAISTPLRNPLVVNVGSGVGTSVGSLAELALELVGREIPVAETKSNGDRRGGQDVTRLVADTRRARDELGWTARVPLKEGLTRALQAF